MKPEGFYQRLTRTDEALRGIRSRMVLFVVVLAVGKQMEIRLQLRWLRDDECRDTPKLSRYSGQGLKLKLA